VSASEMTYIGGWGVKLLLTHSLLLESKQEVACGHAYIYILLITFILFYCTCY